MPKYKQVFQEMLLQNKELFENFQKIHDQYILDPKASQKEFNEKGQDVLDVIRRFENRLCQHTEGSGYGKYSANLADKFQEEIRARFPKIDNIGLEVEKKPEFVFKKLL